MAGNLIWQHHCHVTALTIDGDGGARNVNDVQRGGAMLVFATLDYIKNMDAYGAFAGTLEDLRILRSLRFDMQEMHGLDIIVPLGCWQPRILNREVRILAEARARSMPLLLPETSTALISVSYLMTYA